MDPSNIRCTSRLPRRALVLGSVLVALATTHCSRDEDAGTTAESPTKPKSEPRGSEFPGFAPPPLEQLVETAQALGPPDGTATQYKTPTKVQVPALPQHDLSALPKDEEGRPTLTEGLGLRLTVYEELRDPLTAMGTCMDIVSYCISSEPQDPRSVDECWASARSCTTLRPWLEEQACCPESCQDLYSELRLMGYSELEANNKTHRSHCYPSKREFEGSDQ